MGRKKKKNKLSPTSNNDNDLSSSSESSSDDDCDNNSHENHLLRKTSSVSELKNKFLNLANRYENSSPSSNDQNPSVSIINEDMRPADINLKENSISSLTSTLNNLLNKNSSKIKRKDLICMKEALFAIQNLVINHLETVCPIELKKDVSDIKVAVSNPTTESAPLYSQIHNKLSSMQTSLASVNNNILKTSIVRSNLSDSNYDANKTIIITGVKDAKYLNSSSNIRSELSRHFYRIPIETAYFSAKGKIIVQFKEEDDAKKVISGWNESFFGGETKCQPPTNNFTGFAKDVPSDMTDEEIKNDLKMQFPHATAIRMKKGEKMLNCLKIQFTTIDDLTKSINSGIFLGKLHISISMFKSSGYEPTRCYKCQGFHKTVAHFCKKSQACGFCSESTHSYKDCPHKGDESKAKCVNCHKNHSSNHKLCKSYLEAKDKMKNSQLYFSNSHGK